MKPVKAKPNYEKLLSVIGQTIETARTNAVRVFNTELVKANWEIGRHIIEFEQLGKERAEYGTDLLVRLSKDLKLRYGKGFGGNCSRLFCRHCCIRRRPIKRYKYYHQ